MEAISAKRSQRIQALREYRDRMAHELSDLPTNMDTAPNDALLASAREALFRLFRLSNLWVYIDIGSDLEFNVPGMHWQKNTGPVFQPGTAW
jgi:hypothetical protein